MLNGTFTTRPSYTHNNEDGNAEVTYTIVFPFGSKDVIAWKINLKMISTLRWNPCKKMALSTLVGREYEFTRITLKKRIKVFIFIAHR